MIRFAFSLLCFGFILTAPAAILCAATTPPPPISVVPMPAEVQMGGDSYSVTSKTIILHSPEFADSAKSIHDMFMRAGNIDLKMVEVNKDKQEQKDGSICLFMDSDGDYATTESYRLATTGKGVKISASGAAGAYYGTQTLRQLLPDSIEGTTVPLSPNWSIPGLTIYDTPALEWRGALLDTSRQFYQVDQIKTFLNALALLKMNRFHWHLTDDNGWRIQIDKYPKLTEIASVRGPAKAIYKGFYTKEQIKDVVAYAKERYIEVVPEIEMPAHTNACLVAYPEYACDSTPYKLPEPTAPATEHNSLSWYNTLEGSRHLCAGNDKVFEFLNDIFDETLELFPYGVWHVGGDERPEGIWSNCPKCQARMKTNNLKDEHDLQEWFMRKVSDMLYAKGKTVISWGCTRDKKYYDPEYLDDLGHNAMIINWHGYAKLACKLGIRCVNATDPMYIDYPPFENYPGWERPAWMPFAPMASIYRFNPIPAGITKEQEKFIIGTQVCIWCEVLEPSDMLAWVFPRVLAAAEVAWIPAADRGPYDNFCKRVMDLESRFAFIKVPFGHPVVNGNPGTQHPRYLN